MREEPQLIGIGIESSEPSVQPGDDPLSQFAASSSTSSQGNGSGSVSAQSSEAGVGNHEVEEGASEGVEFRYGRCLTEEDHRAIRNFVLDLVSKKLLPHLNEVLKNLNEWVSGW